MEQFGHRKFLFSSHETSCPASYTPLLSGVGTTGAAFGRQLNTVIDQNTVQVDGTSAGESIAVCRCFRARILQ